jgi:hypothetical protein
MIQAQEEAARNAAASEAAALAASAAPPAASAAASAAPSTLPTQPEQLEQVLSSGLSFLAGIFKMSTGSDLAFRDQKLEVDRQTGEIRLSFKMG